MQKQNPEQKVSAPVARREDWPERLHAFLEERKAMPFAWGENDCALLLCDAVLAMTDVDLAYGFRGKYSTEIGAAKAMKNFTHQMSGRAVEKQNLLIVFAEKIAKGYGIEEVSVGMAHRGDAVLLESTLGPALGIVALDGMSARFAGLDGMQAIALRDCRRAWRIG